MDQTISPISWSSSAEHYRKYPWPLMEYDQALIDRIVAYVWHRRIYGGQWRSAVKNWGWPRARCAGGYTSDAIIPPSTRKPLMAACRRYTRYCRPSTRRAGAGARRGTRAPLWGAPAGFEVRDLRMHELVVLLRQLL